MFCDRYEIRLTLETVTPLHVGTGEVEKIKGMPDRSDTDDRGEYATVARDYDDRPYLPATSIKGALRRLAEQRFPSDPGIEPLFGKIRETEAEQARGGMGRLLVRGGQVTGAMPDNAKTPFPSADKKRVGTFIAARTAIDGKAGVADDHKLFHQEMILPGLCFGVCMTLVSFGKEDDQDRALTLLRRLLALVARDGMALGRSQADGQGLLKVKGGIAIRKHVLNDQGDLELADTISVEPEPDEAASQDIDRRALSLFCAAPFAVIDRSVKGVGKDIAKEQRTVQLSAQRLTSDQPLVLGSSISGALRARTRWLWKLDALRGGTYDGDPVAELFGDVGWRALIEIRNLRIDKAKAEAVTSLKVDRFTGAPVHGALFTTETFTDVRLSFDLVLVKRGKHPGSGAKELWKRLLKDIDDNGLDVGHGTNKGFGWFRREDAA